MSCCSRTSATARFNRSIVPSRRAFSAAVRARLGPSSLALSSWLAVTGKPVTDRISAAACCSCAGLRTLNWLATANADTRSARAVARCSMASRSRGDRSLPWASWPPSRLVNRSGATAALRPVRSSSAAENPNENRPAGSPWPSTNALVASVVDTDTSAIFAARSLPTRSSTALTAWATPIESS